MYGRNHSECFIYFILLFRNGKNELLIQSTTWVNLKIMLSKSSHTKTSTHWMIPFCKILENATKHVATETDRWLPRHWNGSGGCVRRRGYHGTQELSKVMAMFLIPISLTVSWARFSKLTELYTLICAMYYMSVKTQKCFLKGKCWKIILLFSRKMNK